MALTLSLTLASALASRAQAPSIYPGSSWPKADPEMMGMSRSALQRLPDLVGTAIIIRFGHEVWRQGDVDRSRGWSSVGRSFLTTAYGIALNEGAIPGGLAALERPARELKSNAAQAFGSSVKLKHLLSYTSCSNPPGSRWRYSCNWYPLNTIFQEAVGLDAARYLNAKLTPALDGRWRATLQDDGTVRYAGSTADAARWGYFWMLGGHWNGQQLVDPAFVTASVQPMTSPTGGYAHPDEGWQIHLNRTGRWKGCPNDSFAALGGECDSVIFVSPSLGLVVARKGPKMVEDDIGPIMGPICRAVKSARVVSSL